MIEKDEGPDRPAFGKRQHPADVEVPDTLFPRLNDERNQFSCQHDIHLICSRIDCEE
jgi:hypothetical protein